MFLFRCSVLNWTIYQFQFKDNVDNIIAALKELLTEAYAEASQGWQNIENEVVTNIQKYETDFEAIRVRINECFKKA